MGDKYPDGAIIGRCNENQYSGNGCTFEWNREDPVKEEQYIYIQPIEEWKSTFKE